MGLGPGPTFAHLAGMLAKHVWGLRFRASQLGKSTVNIKIAQAGGRVGHSKAHWCRSLHTWASATSLDSKRSLPGRSIVRVPFTSRPSRGFKTSWPEMIRDASLHIMNTFYDIPRHAAPSIWGTNSTILSLRWALPSCLTP